MADVIKLLPDAIANQIAAGEVIQRPASVVKELLENAIDAGSTEIKLVIKDAGKTLIQVIDNGCGMSETDARMSFERHATSKIQAAKDLFCIRTMGFRGEALASIAAIAQIELRTRRTDDEVGTLIQIEGSEIKRQEACQCAAGTTFSVKNLFFNVPARRNFLKSNTVEMRHIIDEFQRVALAHHDVFFSLHHNGSEMYHLAAGNLRQRIVGLLGVNTNKKLVPVDEDTDIIKIYGFVGKVEFAKKTRGEQFFFVNSRFIKSGYLHHAVMSAYEDLMPKENYPLYFLFIEIDPAKIDINVHPTKQEIKFDDERLIYNYLKVTVRHALAQYNVMPTLDFNSEPTFIKNNPAVNPQHQEQNVIKFSSSIGGSPKEDKRHQNNLKNWQKLYEGTEEEPLNSDNEPIEEKETLTIESKVSGSHELDDDKGTFSKKGKVPYQLHDAYIVSQIRSGFMLIDQQAASERILYEKYFKILENQENSIQQELFPKTIELNPSDAIVLNEITDALKPLGMDIRSLGQNTFVVHGLPAGVNDIKEEDLIERLIEQYQKNIDLKLDIQENIARTMAYSTSIKKGKRLNIIEMQELIDQLFACNIPYKSPRGKACFTTFDLEEIEKRLN